MLEKAKIRLLLKSMGCRFSSLVDYGEMKLVCYTNMNCTSWSYSLYTPSLLGLGSLVDVECNLSTEDALFKRDILLKEYYKG